MTKLDLIKRLKDLSDDKVFIITDRNGGWCNIENIVEKTSTIEIQMETTPLFSEN